MQRPLKPRWSGWNDPLSGLEKYSFEVWKLEYSLDNQGLKEPDINSSYNPKPLFIKEVPANGPLVFPSYEPSEPGVYSTILEVSDRANNSKYARRIAIYDKTSEISISTVHRLYVTSASPETNYTWQTTLTSVIQLSWSGHFINEVHEKGHFLSKILDYDSRLDDGVRRFDYKKILPIFDDTEGNRTKSAISPNYNSIVRFQTKVLDLSRNIVITQWSDVSPLNVIRSFNLPNVAQNGDSFQFWVRAYDVMGNSREDSTVLRFDSSTPRLFKLDISFNVQNGSFPFSTR